MKNICIATPSYDNKVTVSYMSSMIDYIIQKKFGVECFVASNDSLITRARNELFTDFYENIEKKNFSYLVWQDSDVYINSDGILKMISSGFDVIGAAVPIKSNESDYGVTCAVTGVYEKVTDYLYKTKYIGTGLMCISSKAAKNLVEYCEKNNNWYWDHLKQRKVYDIFKVGVDENKLYQSEDWYLCHILRKIGYEIYVDSSSFVSHTSYKRDSMPINPNSIKNKFSEKLPDNERGSFWTTNDWLLTST